MGDALEDEEIRADIEDILVGIRVEAGFVAAQCHAALEGVEDLMGRGVGACQQRFQFIALPFAAVDGAQMAIALDAFLVVGGRGQRVDVQPRDALQAQHQGLTGDEALDLPRVLAAPRALERIEVADVELIGGVGAPGVGAHADVATEVMHQPHQSVALVVGQQALKGANADTVVTGGEVEVAAAGRQGRQAGGPLGQGAGIAGGQGVQRQRRQRELIDQVRFIGLGAALDGGEVVL